MKTNKPCPYSKPCPYCDRIMSHRETQQGCCDDCYAGRRT